MSPEVDNGPMQPASSWRHLRFGPRVLSTEAHWLSMLLGGAVGGGLGLGLGHGFADILVGCSLGPTVVGLLAIAAIKMDRMPDWALYSPPPEVDYATPPPSTGPLFNGRADQAPLQEWLRRRGAARSDAPSG